MVHHVLHVVDGGVELALVEMAARKIFIELGKVPLRVLIPRGFLAVMTFKILGLTEIVLRPVYDSPQITSRSDFIE